MPNPSTPGDLLCFTQTLNNRGLKKLVQDWIYYAKLLEDKSERISFGHKIKL